MSYNSNNKIADWEKVHKEMNCWRKPGEVFDTRDFIASMFLFFMIIIVFRMLNLCYW